MILGKNFSWYFKIIQNVLLIAASWIIISSFIIKIPIIGWVFALMTLPITWLLKLGGAGYVGYQTVKKYQGTNLQSLVSGAIFGAGVGLTSMVMALLKMILKANAVGVFFSTFSLIIVVFGEAITGLVVGFIGGLLAGSSGEKK